MGLFGIKTKKDKEHERQMQESNHAHESALKRAELESRERENALQEEQKTIREQQRIAAEEREAEQKRKNAIETARIKAQADVQTAEIERQTQLDLAEKENQKFYARAQAEKDVRIKQEEERTRQVQIDAEKELELAQKQKEQAVALAQSEKEVKQEEERTRQTKINADKEIELAEKNKQIQIQAIETTKEMFTNYLQFVSEKHRAEINFLIHQSENLKAKFLASIEEARKRKEYLLELSKDVKGQEKINYLNAAHDIEDNIKEMQNADKQADMDLAAKLTLLNDSQKREVEEGQAKLTNVNTLFLNYMSGA